MTKSIQSLGLNKMWTGSLMSYGFMDRQCSFMLVQSNLTLMFFSKKGSLQYLQLSVLSGHSLSLWRSCSLALISSLQEGHKMILKSQFPSCPACSRKILSAFFLNVQLPYDAHGCTSNLMRPLVVGTYKVRMCLMLFFPLNRSIQWQTTQTGWWEGR